MLGFGGAWRARVDCEWRSGQGGDYWLGYELLRYSFRALGLALMLCSANRLSLLGTCSDLLGEQKAAKDEH